MGPIDELWSQIDEFWSNLNQPQSDSQEVIVNVIP